jgi:hypothetical protein
VRIVGNQTVVRVFPQNTYDRLLYQGFSGEIWMQEGVTPENLSENMAEAYRETDPKGAVSLVLGAGNVSSIGPMDVLYKLFVENEVCILKMNPVNEYVGPFIEKGFRTLVEAGYLRVVYGGADVGKYLCTHEDVENIHITGSDKTHDMIVWGPPGPEREQRMTAGTPLNKKPISSELGNVSPVIIHPGSRPWSQGQLRFQAQNVAAMVANNGSFNCNAAKLVIVHDEWEQKASFMAEVERALREVPARKAYYPGAQQRYDTFLSAHPSAQPLSERSDDVVPWTLIRDVDSSDRANICFTTEAFCGVLSQTALSAETPADFLRKAVDFCNEDVWGTLSVTLVVHPREKGPEIEQAIADLRYGTVGVNHWPALAYGLCCTTWGAFPGHTLEDIQSGRGVVHNTLLFDKPQKTVIRGPFVVRPKPPWFASHGRTHLLGPRLTAFEASPSAFKLPGIIFNAFLG